MRLLLAALALLAVPPAHAGFHLGPQAGYQIYHRFAPEETASVRASGLLAIKYDFGGSAHFFSELVGVYETGLDQFATQDSVNERIFRVRSGVIYRPIASDDLIFGLRFGGQYTMVSGVLNYNLPPSTNNLNPRFWSPYFGALLGVIPETGFGVEDELTIWYDQYFKCVVYQMSFGVDVF